MADGHGHDLGHPGSDTAVRTSSVRLSLLIMFVLGSGVLHAQDSSAVAPLWALDLCLGGGSSLDVTAHTGPDATVTFDLAGWFHLGAGVERRIVGRWSGRFSFGYESGGWKATGPGNPFAAPNYAADRWVLGAGVVHQVHRGTRSQIDLQGGARFQFGMRVPTIITLDSTSAGSDLRDLTLRYRSAVSPVLAVGWRWRPTRGSVGAIGTSIGMTWFHCTYDGVELPNDVPELPEGLLPMTGAHAGWQLLFTIGYSGWSSS